MLICYPVFPTRQERRILKTLLEKRWFAFPDAKDMHGSILVVTSEDEVIAYCKQNAIAAYRIQTAPTSSPQLPRGTRQAVKHLIDQKAVEHGSELAILSWQAPLLTPETVRSGFEAHKKSGLPVYGMHETVEHPAFLSIGVKTHAMDILSWVDGAHSADFPAGAISGSPFPTIPPRDDYPLKTSVFKLEWVPKADRVAAIPTTLAESNPATSLMYTLDNPESARRVFPTSLPGLGRLAAASHHHPLDCSLIIATDEEDGIKLWLAEEYAAETEMKNITFLPMDREPGNVQGEINLNLFFNASRISVGERRYAGPVDSPLTPDAGIMAVLITSYIDSGTADVVIPVQWDTKCWVVNEKNGTLQNADTQKTISGLQTAPGVYECTGLLFVGTVADALSRSHADDQFIPLPFDRKEALCLLNEIDIIKAEISFSEQESE